MLFPVRAPALGAPARAPRVRTFDLRAAAEADGVAPCQPLAATSLQPFAPKLGPGLRHPTHSASARARLIQRPLPAALFPPPQDGESGWTPLHRAYHFGHLRAAEALLSAGASSAAEDHQGARRRPRPPLRRRELLLSNPLRPAAAESSVRDGCLTLRSPRPPLPPPSARPHPRGPALREAPPAPVRGPVRRPRRTRPVRPLHGALRLGFRNQLSARHRVHRSPRAPLPLPSTFPPRPGPSPGTPPARRDCRPCRPAPHPL